MAVIIARCNHPMPEKHKAWRELIEHYPDMPAPRNWHQNNFDSIHKKLVEIIDYEERVLAMFRNPEPGAFYKYSVWWGDSQVYSDRVFSDYEKALADAKESWDREEAPVIRIEKMFIDDSNKDKGQTITVVDYDSNVQEIDFYCSYSGGKTRAGLFPDIESCKTVMGKELLIDFYIDIPTPFKPGDILTFNTQPGNTSIFVNESLSRDDPILLEQFLHGDTGDGSDLIGWGYYVDENGNLYGDHTLGHDRFEYYRGKLEGKERLLHYASLFMKKEIGLPEMLAMQNRIWLEHQLDINKQIDTHGCYIDEHLLAENRLAIDKESDAESQPDEEA